MNGFLAQYLWHFTSIPIGFILMIVGYRLIPKHINIGKYKLGTIFMFSGLILVLIPFPVVYFIIQLKNIFH